MTVYYDALRGPLAVKPLTMLEGHKVRCRVTARKTHSGYKTGDIIEVFPRDIVKVRGMYCYAIGTDNIKLLVDS